MDMQAQRISEIAPDRRTMTADAALDLRRFFMLSSGDGLRAQAAHDAEVADRKPGAFLKRIEPWAEYPGEQRGAANTASRRC
jgi:plasmid maintenance system antidote protein VapI